MECKVSSIIFPYSILALNGNETSIALYLYQIYIGGVLDNVFSTFPKPMTDDVLDALCLENYLLGMFKLKWKGDCKKAFRFSIICNCRGNMNSYIGEVIGFQNAGMSDIAVQKIEEIQKFVSVAALELFPIDAKRMSDDEKSVSDAENSLIEMIKKNNANYDAILALADLYISQGKWQPALSLMQQPVEADCSACSKNLELRMKWGTILFFNGYVPLANQIFSKYATKDFEASAHEYYCGIAANISYELGIFLSVIPHILSYLHILPPFGLMLFYIIFMILSIIPFIYPSKRKFKYPPSHPNILCMLHISVDVSQNIHHLQHKGKSKDLDKMEAQEKLKGQNVWMLRLLCYKYWVEFFVKKKGKKKKPKQPKSGGKSQYDKAIDCAKKMIKLDEDFPLGHALLARSNVELIEAVDDMKDQIEASVNKADELADELLKQKAILPRFYYETMIHCGVAMYQIDGDGSKYYQKACDKAPHGETVLCKLQREKITSKMDTQATRELLIDIAKNNLNIKSYKTAMPYFAYNLDTVISSAQSWNIFDPKTDLQETNMMGYNITKPDKKPEANPNGGVAGAPPPPPTSAAPKKEKKKKSKPTPDTDDSKSSAVPPPPPTSSGGNVPPPPPEDDAANGPSIESPFRYANLCCDKWPQGRLAFSLPFDDAAAMGDAMTMLVRKELKKLGLEPQDENDLIGRLHWGGEDALQDVLDKCEGKSDPLHLGLANFAFTYKVDMGLGSDEHKQCIEQLSNVVKNLSYEGKLGFAALRGLQCVAFEADELFKEVAGMKDADGSDWLYHRHFGQYLLVVKEDYGGAVKALEKAYKTNPKKDPMTIGWYLTALAKSGMICCYIHIRSPKIYISCTIINRNEAGHSGNGDCI